MKKEVNQFEYYYENKEFKKTIITTFLLSLTSIVLATFVQLNAQSKVNSCSYLDPITIDILAMLVSIFFIIEGLTRIVQNPKDKFTRQLSRILRVATGFAILTLHVIQFVHK